MATLNKQVHVGEGVPSGNMVKTILCLNGHKAALPIEFLEVGTSYLSTIASPTFLWVWDP